MPLLLALDTATRVASVALVSDDGRAVGERTSTVSTHSETLLDLIDQVLRAGGARLRELAGIACGAGPGSFTGLRIGLATCKGLCFGSERPLVLVSSLAALAAQAPPDALAVACLDARKGEVFLAAFAGDEVVEAERALAPADVAVALQALHERSGRREIVLIGDAAARYPELAAVGRWIVCTPSAAAVGRLAWRRLARGEADDLDSAVPRYVRPPEITVSRKNFEKVDPR
ncbi:MAG TPA: tRNA (adenosine(37)-N6)-threonylcarbamoyltransferase complex dimerization subunit type 1 TsaB [Polyangia bacterium]|nr:tRNA (adenosine(37)-N6)-threonylcarbamoyltransferase complex dimerization subunit type 1 TsaB [Polyangia bacterium]